MEVVVTSGCGTGTMKSENRSTMLEGSGRLEMENDPYGRPRLWR